MNKNETENIIHWEIKNKTGYITLNNPPSNMMSNQFFKKLNDLTTSVIPRSNVKGIIIHGKARHFSAGADLSELLDGIKQQTKTGPDGEIITYPEILKTNNESFLYFRSLKIPVVAAVSGVCLGSALELVLFCNIRVCTKNALFGFPETTFNLLPGCAGTINILKHLKKSQAIEMVLTGQNFNAETALKFGIIHKIVNKKELIGLAESLIEKLYQNYNAIQVQDFFSQFGPYC
jgi:enoyl-CoA hydratase/carnithine racemase